MDEGNITGTVFIDFSKAFDLVDHSILIEKLISYKFKRKTLDWFASYLQDRNQIVSFGGAISQIKVQSTEGRIAIV